jgi:acetyl esterase/lipase
MTVPRTDGPEVRVLLYRPRSAPSRNLPVVVHLHGGLYVMGSADDCDALNQLRAMRLNCVLVAVDYRLAPEAPFPGALEDAYTVLKWLKDHGRDLDMDVNRLALVGESAGGGMAAGLALMTRDRGEIKVAFQQLIYPMLDDRTGSLPRSNPYAGEFVLPAETNRVAWGLYLGHEPGVATTSPYASAARAASLKDLPPAHICVGALDLFVDESIEYGRRLINAGVSTDLQVYSGAVHAFDMSSSRGIAERFTQAHLSALARGLGCDQ